ncbi:MAG: branched-chain amino acid ABC transporter substrate-binding protein [Oceanospirillaceae bacterium]|nr:branched-chain amino acid ABC transporter substrate-binding protein [Oceanospirillaceae bacterium]
MLSRCANPGWLVGCFIVLLSMSLARPVIAAPDPIRLGFLYPSSGPYKEMGIAEARAALMAVDEINASGGILGRPVELLIRNSASKPAKARAAVEYFAREKVAMVFGGISSAVAIAAGKEAAKHRLLFFSAHSYANGTTGVHGHRHIFRESYNAWMSSKALSMHINQSLAGKRVFYASADYAWGHSTEASMRVFTRTEDTSQHPGTKIPFPRPSYRDIQAAMEAAENSGADVLILTQAGDDLATAMQIAHTMGLKSKMTIVVPGLTLDTVRVTGVGLLQGVVSTVPWCWKIPYQYGYQPGIDFVEGFVERYEGYPSSSAASTYSILYQFRDAVERTKSLSTERLISAFEGHHYTGLKGPQSWRTFDHQNIQDVFVVRVKDRNQALQDRFNEDFFEILLNVPGQFAARSQEEWQNTRLLAGKPPQLQ